MNKKYTRKQAEEFFIDVYGYSQEELQEYTFEELKLWVSDLNEEYKEDFYGYIS